MLRAPLAFILHFVGGIFYGANAFVGWGVQKVGALFVCFGDPIVYFVNLRWPALLDVADFKFINFRPMIFVTHPE